MAAPQRGFGSPLSHVERHAAFMKLPSAERNRLHDVAAAVNGACVGNRMFALHTYKKVFVGKEAISHLVETDRASSRAAATADMQQLFNAGYFHHPHDAHEFADAHLFFRFVSSSFVSTAGSAGLRSVAALAPSALMSGWLGVGGAGWTWPEKRTLKMRVKAFNGKSSKRFAVLTAPKEEAEEGGGGGGGAAVDRGAREGNLFLFRHDLSSAPLCSIAIDPRCACSVSYCAKCAVGEFGFTVASSRFEQGGTATGALCLPLAPVATSAELERRDSREATVVSADGVELSSELDSIELEEADADDIAADALLSSPVRVARRKLEDGVITAEEFGHIVEASAAFAEATAGESSHQVVAYSGAEEEEEEEGAAASAAPAGKGGVDDDDAYLISVETFDVAEAGDDVASPSSSTAGGSSCSRADGLCRESATRTFLAPSAEMLEKWVHALLKKVGATFVEQTDAKSIVNAARSVYEFECTDSWGKLRSLKAWAGHIIVVVNVATF